MKYPDALRGRLPSVQNGPDQIEVTFINQFPISVTVYWLNFLGAREPLGKPLAAASKDGKTTKAVRAKFCPGYKILFTATETGGFIGVFEVYSGMASQFLLNTSILCSPGDIGPLPKPNADILIPMDSPRVVVGCGRVLRNDDHVVLREQFWNRQNESFSLAPGQERRLDHTVFSGMQKETSTKAELATSLSTDANAGWGAISASVSASLSASGTFGHQITLNEETTSYCSESLKNNSDIPATFFRWQLVDIITVFSSQSDKKPMSILINECPVLTDGPYDLTDIKPLGSFADQLNLLRPPVTVVSI